MHVSQVKPWSGVCWRSVSCIKHACLVVTVHACPRRQILVSWRVTAMRIYRTWGSQAYRASDRRLSCLTSLCMSLYLFSCPPSDRVPCWSSQRLFEDTSVVHAGDVSDQPNGNELTLVLPRFLSCCISVGLQCSGSYPVIIHERWVVSSACGTGPVSLCCDDTGSTIHSHTERWLGWQQRTLRSASVMHHPVLDPQSKNTDGWKKIQLIFRLAELSCKLKIRLRFGWLQTLCG